MVGGQNEVCLGAVSHHNLTDNKWTHTIAKLNTPRRSAGGCFIKGIVYIVGGHSDSKPLNCIERINAVRIVENQPKWQHIKLAEDVFVPTAYPSVAPLNDSELVILGGLAHSNIITYNFKTGELEKVAEQENYASMQNLCNQAARVERNHVVALVQIANETKLIKWTKGST